MQSIVLFGLPGAGKTFVGKILNQDFELYLYDGDLSLPEEMKLAIKEKVSVTDEMRDLFFKKLIKHIKNLKYPKIVITQTFIKEKHRQLFLKEVHQAKFILVQTSTDIREDRLSKRSDYLLDLEYARQMSLNFDTPQIDHQILNNDSQGFENIKKQLQILLK